jgi:hypothetical protein
VLSCRHVNKRTNKMSIVDRSGEWAGKNAGKEHRKGMKKNKIRY